MSTPSSRSAGPPRPLLLGLAALAAVLLVLAVVLGLQVRDDQGEEAAAVQQERATVLGVARQQAANLTSLSSATFEADLDRVRALSTGAFLKDLDQTVAALRAQLAATEFTQTSALIDSGVAQVDGDEASVILALDQTLDAGARSRTDALRLQLDLLRTGGTWLVDNVIYQPSTVSADGPPAGGASPGPSASPSAGAR